MTKSPDTLQFVASMLSPYLREGTAHRSLIGFWTATLLAYLDLKQSVSPDEMAILLPLLFQAIKNKTIPEVQVSIKL